MTMMAEKFLVKLDTMPRESTVNPATATNLRFASIALPRK
jgi:hypothetical protein